QSTRQCPDTVNVSVSFAPLPCQALVAAQTFPASGADVSCERAAAFAGFAESASPAGRPRLAQRLSVPARANTAATARPVRVCLGWRCHHALAKGMAGVRSQGCIRIVSSLRSLCGTGLVVVVIGGICPSLSRDINAHAKAGVKERVRGGTEVRPVRYEVLPG